MTGFFSCNFSNPPPASTLCFMALFGLAWMISLSSFLSSSPTREIDLENSGFLKAMEIVKSFVDFYLPALPALAVLPTRWMYCLMVFGMFMLMTWISYFILKNIFLYFTVCTPSISSPLDAKSVETRTSIWTISSWWKINQIRPIIYIL